MNKITLKYSRLIQYSFGVYKRRSLKSLYPDKSTGKDGKPVNVPVKYPVKPFYYE